MITPKELRIGNYLNWDADHGCAGTLIVERVTEYDYLAVGLAKCQPTSEIEYEFEVEGIEITPEWLQDFGFIPDQRVGYNPFRWPQMNGNSSYFLSMNGAGQWVFSIWQDDIKQNITIRILEYVHDLQNLFFALTGEELKIKEKV
jgi:hypothetical protein